MDSGKFDGDCLRNKLPKLNSFTAYSVRMYNLNKLTRALPYGGGLLDQNPDMIRIWEIINSVVSEEEKRIVDSQKRANKAKGSPRKRR